ncbi:hypothetical protein CANARDRAFT_7072 [[Candida] arabinofermentans NRRL YB-2248]|uniref:Zn(2)-C6 fungal-type domain-containing protein n=1 Tax=[Candida] arabinofermentans NRRL YB-2248 TaxID=983967 RepID=A0A1E4T1T1_9ASCO|nr:hypothetical protein CANARDRAFT_7072 [[Candida] arabinofermentans NRRL YB-2248]
MSDNIPIIPNEKNPVTRPILPNPLQQKQMDLEKDQEKVTSRIVSDDAKERRTKACTRCRRSKVRCMKSGDDQACKRCKAHNLSCVYEYKIASYKIVSSDEPNTFTTNFSNPSQLSVNNTNSGIQKTARGLPAKQAELASEFQMPKKMNSTGVSTASSTGPSLSGLLNPIAASSNSTPIPTPAHTPTPFNLSPSSTLDEPSSEKTRRILTRPDQVASISQHNVSTKSISPSRKNMREESWEDSVESRFSDLDGKLGTILTLLRDQNQQRQTHQQLPSINNQPQLTLPHPGSSQYYYDRPQLTERQYSDEILKGTKRLLDQPSNSGSSKRADLRSSSSSPLSSQSQSQSQSPPPLIESKNVLPSLVRSVAVNSIDQIMTKDEAKELFKYFDSNISPQLFGFNLSHYSVLELWDNCPFLVATVCAIASIHHPLLSHLFKGLDSFIHNLSQQLLFKYPASELEAFNTVLALCFCGFWFQQNQMFTGLALQLAKTMNLNKPSFGKKSGISEKNRLKLWYLLYILDGQQSLVFNRQPLMDSKDQTFVQSRQLLLHAPTANSTATTATILPVSDDSDDLNDENNNAINNKKNNNDKDSQDTITNDQSSNTSKAETYSDMRLVSQVEYNLAVSSVFDGEAWDLLTPASFGLPFKTNLELDKWMVQWTVLLSPFGKNPIWSSKSTLIYYNFAKMHINSSAVRNLHTDGTTFPKLEEYQAANILEDSKMQHTAHNVTSEDSKPESDSDSDSDLSDSDSEEVSDGGMAVEMSPAQSKKVSSELSISAAETVLNIVLNDPDILSALKYVPIHIHIMLYYAALLILNPPAYLEVDNKKSFDDSLASIKLVKKLRVIIIANVPIDQKFSNHLIDAITGMLQNKVTALKRELEACADNDSSIMFDQLNDILNQDDNYLTQSKKSQKIVAWPGIDHSHPNWDDVSKSVVRTPQILKNKFISQERISDPEFDKIVETIKGLDKQFDNLQSSLKKNRVSLSQLLKSCIGIGNIIQEISNPTSNTNEPLTKQQLELYNGVTAYLVKYRSLQPSIETELKMFEERLGAHLKNISKHIKYANKAIKERYFANLDYQKFSEEFKALNEKPDLSLKDHKRKFEVMKKLDDAKGKYELLNNRLKQEIPLFMMIIAKIMAQIFVMMYFATCNIFYMLFETVDSMTEQFNLDLEEERKDKDYHLCKETFHNSFDPVSSKIDKFQIVNFHRISLNKLQEKVMQTGSSYQTCHALYSFTGVEDEDLTFSAGEQIRIIDKSSPGWWKGMKVSDGTVGIFPYNYVQLD